MAIPFEARLPGTPLGVRMLRREMAGIAADCGMDAEGVADVKLAVTEAATNAVMRAYSEAAGELSVSAAVQGESSRSSSATAGRESPSSVTAPGWGSASPSSPPLPSG